MKTKEEQFERVDGKKTMRRVELLREINLLEEEIKKDKALFVYEKTNSVVNELITLKENLVHENYLEDLDVLRIDKCLDVLYIVEARLKKIAKCKKED